MLGLQEEFITKIRYDNSVRVKNRTKVSSFFSDCEAIINHLSTFNYVYKGKTHDLGSNLLFIVGLPRSGKSITEKLLSGTGIFECKDESYSLSNILGMIEGPDNKLYKYPEYLPMMSDNIFPQMAKDINTLLERRVGETDKIITNTMPGNFLYIPLLKKIFPKCKILWCHRNKQKHLAALYCKRFKHSLWNFTDSIEELLSAYNLYYDVYRLYALNMPGEFLNLNFEETLLDPENSISKILDFIEITYSKNYIYNSLEVNMNHISNIRYIDENIKKYLVYLPEFLDSSK